MQLVHLHITDNSTKTVILSHQSVRQSSPRPIMLMVHYMSIS